jgi:hypothetical protein
MPEPTVTIDLTGANKMPDVNLTEMFRDRLLADRDRHSSNATSFEKILEMQYAQSMQFRDANAARIVMEAGSGRTRSESNGPNNTAAQRDTP